MRTEYHKVIECADCKQLEPMELEAGGIAYRCGINKTLIGLPAEVNPYCPLIGEKKPVDV